MKKYTIIYIIALLLCFSYTACKNPPIFAAIEQEVKLKKASVVGFVRGITQINNDLYVSNGKLFTKTVGDTGKWSSISAPGTAGSLATDGTKLYGVFDGNAYVLDGSWKKVNTSIGIVGGTTTVFGQDSSNKIYTISGQTATSITDGKGFFKGAAGNFCITENGVYTASGLVSVSGVPTSGLKAICEGASSPNTVFVVAGGTLYAYNGSTWTSIAHSQSAPQSVTYVKNRKLVIISGTGGFSEIKLDDTNQMDLTNAKAISVGRDALSSVPASCYHQYLNSIGKWNINPIYSVKTNNNDYSIYAGAIDSNTKYTGLWGFYNPGQLEWNRE